MKKKDYKRDIIIRHGLLDHIDDIDITDRNRQIVERYARGESLSVIAEDLGLSYGGASYVIGSFIGKVAKHMMATGQMSEDYNIYLQKTWAEVKRH